MTETDITAAAVAQSNMALQHARQGLIVADELAKVEREAERVRDLAERLQCTAAVSVRARTDPSMRTQSR